MPLATAARPSKGSAAAQPTARPRELDPRRISRKRLLREPGIHLAAGSLWQDMELSTRSAAPGPSALTVPDVLTLLDWKRAVFELYAEIRSSSDPEHAWRRWRETREGLFRGHPKSPVSEPLRAEFRGCRYFDYDPAARALATVVPSPPEDRKITTSTGVSYTFTRFGEARFELYGRPCSLQLYWLEGYGGGLFVPFGDGTSGETTYPAGRYLLDTVKGADLGYTNGRLVFDFNFAYNPSCAYDPRWVCPLAPTDNWLPVHVAAGEQTP